jgi:hypothetical protein
MNLGNSGVTNSLNTFERFLQEVRDNQDKVGAILSHTIPLADDSTTKQVQRRRTFHSVQNYKSNGYFPSKNYFPEVGLSKEMELTRHRLASRFATMDFPFDSCMEALK